MKKMYKDVLVLHRSGYDMYLGRVSGSFELGYAGKWIKLDNNEKIMDTTFYGGEFLVVDDLEVVRMLNASRILMDLKYKP